jgi:hydroxyacylglutathione hydrolase
MEVINVTEDADVFTSNVFLALGAEPTLVDAGAMDGIEDAIRQYTDDIEKVVLTHQHGDHVAQLDAVCSTFDADCYAYAPHDHRTHELAAGDEVRIGDERCEVVHTPGHADDHVSLVGQQSLFSGDVVVYNDGAFDDGSFGRTDYPGQSRERLIESIRELRECMPDSIDSLYAGHGDVFTGDVHEVVERALSRAEKREPKYPEE